MTNIDLSELILDSDNEDEKEYAVNNEYTDKQDISDCFVGLRKHIQPTFGVCYKELKKETIKFEVNESESDTDSDMWDLL